MTRYQSRFRPGDSTLTGMNAWHWRRSVRQQAWQWIRGYLPRVGW
jgi:hypothetical protein